MGQRSSTETVVAIVLAFQRRRTWAQADLAKAVGIAVPALRRCLVELEASGLPLVRDEDHPHVYWSVPKDWFPGGVVLTSAEVVDLLRQLARLPRSTARDRWLAKLLEAAPRKSSLPAVTTAVITPEATENEQMYLPVAEDSVTQRAALWFRYFTASRGALETRHASVQRILPAPAPRLLAVCHRDGRLKWFRVDNILSARLDSATPYRTAPAEEVEALLQESIDGFHQGGKAIDCSFFVKTPEARWVERNLPGPMAVETIGKGVRISTRTAGVLRLARFVVGLGAAAEAETPELRALVKELAAGAIQAYGPLADARDSSPGSKTIGISSGQP